MGAETFFRRGLACLADDLFAARGFRVFFAEGFLAVGFFIEISLRLSDASIGGDTATVKSVNHLVVLQFEMHRG